MKILCNNCKQLRDVFHEFPFTYTCPECGLVLFPIKRNESDVKRSEDIEFVEEEISRILDYFSISPIHKDSMLNIYRNVHAIYISRVIYKDPEVLVPLIIYFYCKSHEIQINIFELVKNSKLTLDLFSDFIFQMTDSNFLDMEFSLEKKGDILSIIYRLTKQIVYSVNITDLRELDSFLLSPYYKLVYEKADKYINQIYAYEINDFITVGIKKRKTMIFIVGRPFHQCMRLLINIPVDQVEKYDEIESIDEVASHIKDNFEETTTPYYITPFQEFRGHCSNLQVWYENEYDTRFLRSNLSFPLLQELYEVGDPIAINVFKKEIVDRFKSGYPSTVLFLLENNYLDYLTNEEKLSYFANFDISSLDRLRPFSSTLILHELYKIGILEMEQSPMKYLYKMIKDHNWNDINELFIQEHFSLLDKEDFANFSIILIKELSNFTDESVYFEIIDELLFNLSKYGFFEQYNSTIWNIIHIFFLHISEEKEQEWSDIILQIINYCNNLEIYPTFFLDLQRVFDKLNNYKRTEIFIQIIKKYKYSPLLKDFNITFSKLLYHILGHICSIETHYDAADIFADLLKVLDKTPFITEVRNNLLFILYVIVNQLDPHSSEATTEALTQIYNSISSLNDQTIKSILINKLETTINFSLFRDKILNHI